jgi:diaminopimelate epimerase
MKLQFIKMHSLGNDFVVLDDRAAKLKKIRQLAVNLCDRRFGIGADQLLVLGNSKNADFRMRILNADGSEVEMCGNGIRCLAQYIWQNIIKSEKTEIKKYLNCLSIETLAGIIHLQKSGKLINVNMGEPIFDPEKIPVLIKAKGRSQQAEVRAFHETPLHKTPNSKLILNYPLKIKDKTFKITCVSMGNPHAIIVVKDVASFPVQLYGPMIEKHNLFPKRTNVEFIQKINSKNIKMRVWERGSGETMACGTGASASAVASALMGLTDRKVTIHLPGGRLLVYWSEIDNHVYMTGDAVKVFEGTIVIPAKAGIRK